MQENIEKLEFTMDYKHNIKCFNECLNNTKDITESEMQDIYFDCGCDINCVEKSVEFDCDNDKYEIISQFIINGGEGQGEDFEEISKVIDKETSNVYFVSFNSYYDSWEGNDYEDATWCIVKPVIRTTIEFVANK